MNRLLSELHRLYLPRSPADLGSSGRDTGSDSPSLIGPGGMVRAMVLALARPADWEALATVWRGVQTDLALPAPAVAVSGTDGFQLWFSLAEPIGVAQAHAFLDALRRHFLPDVAPARVGLLPVADATAPPQARHAPWVPALQQATGQWSAFVSPDLAPMFAETPWLDIPPGDDGQADLLSRLESIKPPAFDAALAQLTPTSAQPPATAPQTLGPGAGPLPTPPVAAAGSAQARRFLLRVMNDESVALALRIEAAKALLPHADEPRLRPDAPDA